MDPVIIKAVGSDLTVGYSGKLLGNTNPGFGDGAAANFAEFTAMFPGKTVYDMPAVGKDNIVNVDGLTPEALDRLEADALVTKSFSALLVLKAADCIPLVLYVPGQKLLALVHAGTSGAALHLPRKAVETLGFAPDQIHCYIGPSISQKSYRFSEQEFEKKLDPSWNNYITHEADGIHINLIGYVLDELKKTGLSQANIQIEPVDTGADNNYFSHRRHKLSGELDGRNCFAVCWTNQQKTE